MKKVVVFDLDGTLTNNDTFVSFLLFVLKKQPGRWLRTWNLPFATFLHKAGFRDNTWLKIEFLKSIVGGLSTESIQQIGSQFSLQLLNSLRQGALAQVDYHRQQGDLLILATASPDLYVRHLADHLGFDSWVCTQLSQQPIGYVDGQLIDGNCYGENKLTKLKTHLESLGYEHIDVGYSDHEADLPLLTFAKRGVAVSPTKKLAQQCHPNGFEILRWN